VRAAHRDESGDRTDRDESDAIESIESIEEIPGAATPTR
jgi:hypothetical protein